MNEQEQATSETVASELAVDRPETISHEDAEALAVALFGKNFSVPPGRLYCMTCPVCKELPPTDDRTQLLMLHRNPSTGTFWFECRRGCTEAAVLTALRSMDLWPPGRKAQCDEEREAQISLLAELEPMDYDSGELRKQVAQKWKLPLPRLDKEVGKRRRDRDKEGEPATVIPIKRDTDDERTDVALAERFAAQNVEHLRYCPNRGYLAWDGMRWRNDDTGEAARRAKVTAAGIFQEAAAATNAHQQRELSKLALRAGSVQGQRAILELARCDARLVVTIDMLDRDPWALNCENGTLDLRTGERRKHRPEDLITKLVPVAYDPEASCPRWIAFLIKVLVRTELIEYMQRVVGYALTGITREQCFFFLYGSGDNGKSRFLAAVEALLGDYAARISADALMVTRDRPLDLARLPGVHLAIASELEAGARLHEARVKDLTGGDKITAQAHYRMPFEFQPECKLMLYGNHKPAVRGTDHGIWRRVRLVPFTVQIPKAEQESADVLDAQLARELPGILAWAVRGCLAWQHDGLGDPEAVREATAEYRSQQDVLAAWIEERCEVGKPYAEEFTVLYRSYAGWCLESNERAMSKKAFGSTLTERDFRTGPNVHHRERLGLRLRLAGGL